MDPNTRTTPREAVATWFWVTLIAFLAMYVFALVLGVLSFAPDAIGVAAAMGAILLAFHEWRQYRHRSEIIHDRRLRDARERRGF